MEEFKFPDEIDAEIKVPADDGIEINIVDDTPAQDRGRKPLDKDVADPTDDEINSYSESVKKRIKDLTHARHDERRVKEATLREKQELERLAQQLLNENKQLKQYVNEGSKQYGDTIKTAAEQEIEMARQKFRAAQEAFDSEKMLAAQEALTDAKMRLAAANNFRPATLPIENNVVQTQQVPQTNQPDEATLRWQAKNQWFGAPGFEEYSNYALGLHQKLVAQGINSDHPEYFERIDARVKTAFPELFGEANRQSAAESSPRRTTSVVAPAARSTGKKVMTLTQTQVALARRFGLTNQQYAEQVLKLEK